MITTRDRRRGRVLLLGLLTVVGLGGSACGGSTTVTPRDDSAAAFVFESRCASCHTPGGPGKDTAVMDLTDARRVIVEGRLDMGMPAFAGVLTTKQIDEMVEWLATQQGVPMPTATTAAGPEAP